MKLKDLVTGITTTAIEGMLENDILSLHLDSRGVEQGGLFFAIKGTAQDGHEYIHSAIEKGAVAIVCEEMPKEFGEGVTYIQVENTGAAVGPIASTFYDHPSSKLKVVGVTGTNGKTTTATLLHELFTKLGKITGLVSTIENKIGNTALETKMTTPDALSLQKLFKDMVDAGCTYIFMEVSSHAAHQGRVFGIDFAGAVFTNITHEHLDYHNTFEEYLKAKQGFFDMLHSHAFALANYDDENGQFMLQSTKASKNYYGLQTEDGSFAGEVQFEGKLIANTFNGVRLEINGEKIESKLIGRFNAYNLLAIFGTAVLLGVSKDEVIGAIAKLAPARGRFQHIEQGGLVGVVDYAHTPDALENVLKTIHDIKSANQHVFTLIGCGGDRDRGKRPLMARIAHKYSDQVFLTSDNPRSEDPEKILDDMEAGLDDPKDDPKVTRIVDRKEAIKRAVEIAHDGDIILVAGKGHENYQIIGDETRHFDDMEVLKEALASR